MADPAGSERIKIEHLSEAVQPARARHGHSDGQHRLARSWSSQPDGVVLVGLGALIATCGGDSFLTTLSRCRRCANKKRGADVLKAFRFLRAAFLRFNPISDN
jgi:hypothetical protein